MTIPRFPTDQDWPIHPNLIQGMLPGGGVGLRFCAQTPGGSGGM